MNDIDFNPQHPVTIYVDGSCLGNPGDGAWGYYMTKGQREAEAAGRQPDTTNNRMELQAPIEALSRLSRPSTVTVITDSTYVCNGITRWLAGWVKKGWTKADGGPVANRDLWERLAALSAKHRVSWEWVKAHAGNRGNERADALARRAARSLS